MREARTEEDDRGQEELALQHLLKNLKQVLGAINRVRDGKQSLKE
jgi:hypothetical protein